MKYSIVLYFDNETESKIQNIINSLVINGVNDYLILNNVPPHITLSDFDCDDLNEVAEKLHIEIKRMEKSYVYWASIGAFNPNILFFAPVLNEFLQGYCCMVHNVISNIAGRQHNKNYLPYQWVPHTTIAAKLDADCIDKAFSIVSNEFQGMGGYVTRAALVQNNPRMDIKVWEMDSKI